MPFWKKSFSKARGVYYPRAIVQGNPAEVRHAVGFGHGKLDEMPERPCYHISVAGKIPVIPLCRPDDAGDVLSHAPPH